MRQYIVFIFCEHIIKMLFRKRFYVYGYAHRTMQFSIRFVTRRSSVKHLKILIIKFTLKEIYFNGLFVFIYQKINVYVCAKERNGDMHTIKK